MQWRREDKKRMAMRRNSIAKAFSHHSSDITPYDLKAIDDSIKFAIIYKRTAQKRLTLSMSFNGMYGFFVFYHQQIVSLPAPFHERAEIHRIQACC